MSGEESLLEELRKLANPNNVEGMARFGINPHGTLGISIPTLRAIAKRNGKNHEVAGALWHSGIHEARILASMVEDPKAVTSEQMDAWVADFDSWDVCDQVCSNLFCRTPHAQEKVAAWAKRDEEFIRRAAFALICAITVYDKKAPDDYFLNLLPLIEKHAADPRNFVKKAVNWALRQIGKRNPNLWVHAMATAERIARQPHPSARWIARDAIRELKSRAPKSP